VFFIAYLVSELLRRKGRTIVTVLGLALGAGLLVAVSALSRGLDQAQKTALDPLSTIGTDLTVTRSVAQDGGSGAGFAAGRELIAANQSVLTDLSKLGKPGEQFVHDFFLPGTQLTFPQKQGEQLAGLDGVSAVSSGLLLAAVHQEGTVPKIVAQFQTGGQEVRIDQQIEPLTAAEIAQVQACVQKAQAGGTGGGANAQPPQGGFAQPGSGAEDRGARAGGFSFGPLRECLPERFRRFRATFTTPRETLRQVLDPPQTDIKSEPYTIGGVDQRRSDIGLVTPGQVTGGRFLSPGGGREALLAETYAGRHKLAIDSTLTLNGTAFRVVGLVRPPLGGQTADIYLPLAQLQKLARQGGRANIVLVRATDASSVGRVQREIERTLGGAQVASAKEVADRISGSLVDAANLSSSLGIALSAVGAAAAFLIAALLTLSSVGKRVRELGTLKALGWTQRLVVRQVVGESLAQGVVGGLLGVGLGVAGAAAVDAFGVTLDASSTSGGGGELFGLGEITARTATAQIVLQAPVAASIVLAGFGLAVAGGLLAGAAGALRAARLRPADALRQVE